MRTFSRSGSNSWTVNDVLPIETGLLASLARMASAW